MNLPFYIARRYLFSKKSHNAINIISMVSVCGVVVVTIALVCILSVFNGFNDIVAGLFSNLEPDLKITPATGKVFDPSITEIQAIREMKEVTVFSETLEENALIRCRDRQVIGIVKGVDPHYAQLTQIDSVLVDGRFSLREDVVDYATLGMGLAYSLGVRVGFVSPIEICAPKRDKKINTNNLISSLDVEYAYINGIFRINQSVYDDSYIFVPIELTRSLFRYEKEVSAIELKLTAGADVSSVKKEIKTLIGDSYIVQDRYEQQEASYKMMQIEKIMTFLILSFILAIALFNLVGSLSMLMIEKQNDVQTLRKMGANERLIQQIFLFEGWMISGFGAVIGIIIGLILCFLQMKYGWIRLGEGAAFIIDAYPVRVIFWDILIVLITVLSVGFFSAWYPVHAITKKWFTQKEKDKA